MKITPNHVAGRVGELPTNQIRLAHGTLNARDSAALSDAEHAVLQSTTAELAGRGEPMCGDCAGLTSGFTVGYVHAGWCPQARQKEAS